VCVCGACVCVCVCVCVCAVWCLIVNDVEPSTIMWHRLGLKCCTTKHQFCFCVLAYYPFVMGTLSPGTKLSERKDCYSHPFRLDYKTIGSTNFKKCICGMRKSDFISIRYAEYKTDRHVLNTSQLFSLFSLYSRFITASGSHRAICFNDTFTWIKFYSIMKYHILTDS